MEFTVSLKLDNDVRKNHYDVCDNGPTLALNHFLLPQSTQ